MGDNMFKKADSAKYTKSILIVDDDPNYLRLIREWLKDDYKIYMANSGLQAIKLLGINNVTLYFGSAFGSVEFVLGVTRFA